MEIWNEIITIPNKIISHENKFKYDIEIVNYKKSDWRKYSNINNHVNVFELLIYYIFI